MEWLQAIAVPNLTGWGAFISLAFFNVISVMRGWVLPAVVSERFEQAWEREHANRVALEESKHPAVLAAVQANTEQLEGLRTALDELIRLQREPQ